MTNFICLQIPQVFHRKIHPGNSIAIKERDASQGYAYSKNDEHRNSTGDSFSQEDGRSLSHGIQSKERINTAKFSDLKEDGNSSDKLQGHWIKTDADCKYETLALSRSSTLKISNGFTHFKYEIYSGQKKKYEIYDNHELTFVYLTYEPIIEVTFNLLPDSRTTETAKQNNVVDKLN